MLQGRLKRISAPCSQGQDTIHLLAPPASKLNHKVEEKTAGK